MKTEICLSYIRKWLYRGSPVDMTITEMPLREMELERSPGNDLRMSHQVILSFAFIVFGTHHGQTLTAQEGYAMYGKALLDLNEAMSDPTCYTQDEVYLSQWESDPNNTYTESPSIPPSESLQPHGTQATLKPTPYEFHQDSAAIMLMMYNTTLIHLLRILVTPSTQTQNQQHAEDPYRAAEKAAAIEISRCVPYYLNAESREQLGSSPILCWAIIAALRTLGGKGTVEGVWMMEGLGSAVGGDIARLL
ncbi:hypothetical protein LTR48_002893 [Friedmanniomyces endolithicus]|uniref:Transcription factor domain-containing protein n=1 Tax=Rachicladosporium monterosium TaxID=1507873 RepID=A0ABR0L9J1_9PEZI|nr:hypothetical protein LTR48_002893 [Friedmanniomyces endolithicus]KAK5145553.1 hypothetical protein LTR32_002716 [Rachicladosporium monterosium]